MKRLLIAGLVLVGCVGLVAQGPLTPLMSLRTRTDANGYLMTGLGGYTAPAGPLTPMGNLLGRTDASGNLYVTLGLANASGVLTNDGSGGLSWAAAGSGLTVGTSTITSGTSGRVLYDNAGVLGEYTVTGTGSVVLSAAPALTGSVTMTGTEGVGALTVTGSTGGGFAFGDGGSATIGRMWPATIASGSRTSSNYALYAASDANGTYLNHTSTVGIAISNTAVLTATSTLITLVQKPKFSANNTTGAGSALLGANSPAVTLTAPYTWVTVITSDGSTGYIPVWK